MTWELWAAAIGALFGLVGALTGTAGIWLSVIALRETRWSPVREEQHETLRRIERLASDVERRAARFLPAVLEPDFTHDYSDSLRRIAKATQEIAFDPVADEQIARSVANLESLVGSSDDGCRGGVLGLQVELAAIPGHQADGDAAVRLRAALAETLQKIHAQGREIRIRARELRVTGLGLARTSTRPRTKQLGK